MDTSRFDRIAQRFAHRRFTKHAAQDAPATPATGSDVFIDPSRKPVYLFVQSFQSGTVAPKEGEAGTYTVTLAGGLGQTVYFADRPFRDVGAAPTPLFLDGLGFVPDNPPNAALVLETAPGTTEIAVVELLNPTYETVNHTATYDVRILENWEDTAALGLQAAPADLAAAAPRFGAAHLFIDDCHDSNVECLDQGPGPSAGVGRGSFGSMGQCWDWSYWQCMPCDPYYGKNPYRHATDEIWSERCNARFPDCRKYNPEHGCYAVY